MKGSQQDTLRLFITVTFPTKLTDFSGSAVISGFSQGGKVNLHRALVNLDIKLALLNK